jgi:hypothetical protein
VKTVTPITGNWTRALLIVASKAMITTEGVAVELYKLKPGRYRPTPARLRSSDLLLSAMKQRGLLRQCHPWTPGKLWAVTEWGREIARALKRSK